jgi:hypothetical protein
VCLNQCSIEELKVYVARNFSDYASDYTTAIQDRRLNDPAPVEEPVDAQNILAVKRWENQEKKRDKTVEADRQFTYALYMLVLGQCTPAMRSLLESRDEFHTIGTNGFGLLSRIQKLTYSVDDKKRYTPEQTLELLDRFTSFKQMKFDKITEYHRKFQTFTEALEDLGINFVPEAVITKVAEANGPTCDTATDEDQESYRSNAVHPWCLTKV